MNRIWTHILVGLAALVVVGLLALNVTGTTPVPVGPLGQPQPAVPDSGGVSTLTYDPQRTAEYLTALVENTGAVPVTVLRVTPVGVTVPGSAELVGSLPFNSDDPREHTPSGMDRIMLGIQEDPGPGWATMEPVTGMTVDPKGAAQYQGRAFLVRVTPDPTRETTVLRFDVEYTIGPLHFVTTAWGPVGTTVIMCPRGRPMAAQDGCVAA